MRLIISHEILFILLRNGSIIRIMEWVLWVKLILCCLGWEPSSKILWWCCLLCHFSLLRSFQLLGLPPLFDQQWFPFPHWFLAYIRIINFLRLLKVCFSTHVIPILSIVEDIIKGIFKVRTLTILLWIIPLYSGDMKRLGNLPSYSYHVLPFYTLQHLWCSHSRTFWLIILGSI